MNGGNTLTANSQVNMYGERAAATNVTNYDASRFAGITWKNGNVLRAPNMIIQGVTSNINGAGMQFGDHGGFGSGTPYTANVTFDGNVSLTGRGGGVWNCLYGD